MFIKKLKAIIQIVSDWIRTNNKFINNEKLNLVKLLKQNYQILFLQPYTTPLVTLFRIACLDILYLVKTLRNVPVSKHALRIFDCEQKRKLLRLNATILDSIRQVVERNIISKS